MPNIIISLTLLWFYKVLNEKTLKTITIRDPTWVMIMGDRCEDRITPDEEDTRLECRNYAAFNNL